MLDASASVVPSCLRYFAEDVAPSCARGSTGSWPSLSPRVVGADGVGGISVWRPEFNRTNTTCMWYQNKYSNKIVSSDLLPSTYVPAFVSVLPCLKCYVSYRPCRLDQCTCACHQSLHWGPAAAWSSRYIPITSNLQQIPEKSGIWIRKVISLCWISTNY